MRKLDQQSSVSEQIDAPDRELSTVDAVLHSLILSLASGMGPQRAQSPVLNLITGA